MNRCDPDPADLAAFYLGPIQLTRVLAVGPEPWPQLARVCEARQLMLDFITLNGPLPTATRYDLAIVYDFDSLDKGAATRLFGHLKNEICEQIWAVTSPRGTWQMQDFVALGFRKDRLPHAFDAIASYSYNLESYNHRRDWNNPRFWANPQNWHLRF